MPEPQCKQVSAVYAEGVCLTNAIWCNSYGSYQPETGIRNDDGFHLIEHGWEDWPAVNTIILMALRKNWEPSRINRLFWQAREQGRLGTLRKIAENDR